MVLHVLMGAGAGLWIANYFMAAGRAQASRQAPRTDKD